MAIHSLKGLIKGVKYNPYLNQEKLTEYDLAQFDVNAAKAYGLVNIDTSGNNLAFSKWVTPKRTRTYPFPRIYNIYGLSTKRVTINTFAKKMAGFMNVNSISVKNTEASVSHFEG